MIINSFSRAKTNIQPEPTDQRTKDSHSIPQVAWEIAWKGHPQSIHVILGHLGNTRQLLGG